MRNRQPMRNRLALAAHNARLQWRIQMRDRRIEHLNYEVTRVTHLNLGAVGTMAGLQDEIERLQKENQRLIDEATEAAVTGTGWLEDLRAARAENERLRQELADSRRITIRPADPRVVAPTRPTDLPTSLGVVVPLWERRDAA